MAHVTLCHVSCPCPQELPAGERTELTAILKVLQAAYSRILTARREEEIEPAQDPAGQDLLASATGIQSA